MLQKIKYAKISNIQDQYQHYLLQNISSFCDACFRLHLTTVPSKTQEIDSLVVSFDKRIDKLKHNCYRYEVPKKRLRGKDSNKKGSLIQNITKSKMIRIIKFKIKVELVQFNIQNEEFLIGFGLTMRFG